MAGAFNSGVQKIAVYTARGGSSFPERFVARMAELADATDSKSVAL